MGFDNGKEETIYPESAWEELGDEEPYRCCQEPKFPSWLGMPSRFIKLRYDSENFDELRADIDS
jgi:hypothetical protein